MGFGWIWFFLVDFRCFGGFGMDFRDLGDL